MKLCLVSVCYHNIAAAQIALRLISEVSERSREGPSLECSNLTGHDVPALLGLRLGAECKTTGQALLELLHSVPQTL